MKYLFSFIFVLFSFINCEAERDISNSETVIRGFIDLSKIPFEKGTVVALDGEWEFYHENFLMTDKKDISTLDPIYLQVPNTWNGVIVRGQELSGQSYGSYRLKFILDTPNQIYAIKALDLATSYKIWVNGEEVFSNGKIGKSMEEAVPQFYPDIVYVKNLKEENELIVEISNFSHLKAGFWESLTFGSLPGIQSYREKKFGFDLFLTGSLLIMGIYHIGLFSLRRNDKSSLLLGIFCFIMIFRLITTGERELYTYFPEINWFFGMKLEYLTFYLATPVFSAFLNSLYEEEFRTIPTRVILLVSGFFAMLVIFLPVNLFVRTAVPYQIITVLCMFYGVYALIKAGLAKKDGAFIALTGFIVLVFTIINDILYGNFLINTAQLAPFGLFIFIFSQAFMLSSRFSRAFLNVEVLSQDLSKTNKAYSRFVPTEFLGFLKKENIMDVKLGDQIRKEMTILFSDIRSFTELSENMSPEENFDFINSYLKYMSPIIRRNGGFIDKYIGDAIMALFPESPDSALETAMQMIEGLSEFNKERVAKELSPIRIGIGIHKGSLMLGTVGDPDRMEGTVISDAVNLASRLEGLTKIYGASIIISEQTLVGLDDASKYAFRFLGRVEVKGKKETSPVFEVYEADEKEIKSKKAETQWIFEKAIHAFFSGEKAEALRLFETVFEKNHSDVAAFYYLQKCKLAKSFDTEKKD
ncbi:MAG: adenylate/guanylate cyclase domain-containing protein [Leptospiraceae bacterium]|nr:adenylate/guanylate cyclase domain-containing protein [Leptospiraceae bacterium]